MFGVREGGEKDGVGQDEEDGVAETVGGIMAMIMQKHVNVTEGKTETSG